MFDTLCDAQGDSGVTITTKGHIMIRKALIVGGALAALLSTAACDDSHSDAPDPTPGSFVNAPNVKGFKLPDGYRNVITFCDGPNLVYETSRGGTGATAEGTSSALYVLPNDPRCTGKPQ